LDELTKANIVATALFGDGAGACILRAGEGGIAEIDASGEHTWPDTLDIMGWNVDPEGFGVIFARSIPPFAEAHMGSAVMGILDRAGLHPGGKKVVTALERALALDQGSLDHERSVLSEYGNMSAPTALFVLEQVIGAGLPNRSVLAALGPGFTASCVALKRVT
jgi:alkylresorcinol/alkylpyrone synthase